MYHILETAFCRNHGWTSATLDSPLSFLAGFITLCSQAGLIFLISSYQWFVSVAPDNKKEEEQRKGSQNDKG
jgi:hypothetical protein